MSRHVSVVTGGSGFIGRHMVDLLISKGHEVRVIDNFSGGWHRNLEHHNSNTSLKIDEIDIRSLQENSPIFEDADYVFHFAGIGDIVPSIENPKEYMEVNVQGTVNLLECA